MSNTEIVRLNVGGTKYVTTKSTLWKYPQSMLGAMFMGNVPLSTDEDGYYFIDRCGHIFQYILQFLRCGKLLLPKHFSELDLLQTEADFFQIEGLISAVEHHKRAVEVKEWDEIYVLMLCNFHYIIWDQPHTDIKLFKKSKDTRFNFVSHGSDLYNEDNIKGYLQSDCWVRKEQKTYQYCSAHAFLSLRGIDMRIFDKRRQYTHVDVEIWIRNRTVDFQIFL